MSVHNYAIECQDVAKTFRISNSDRTTFNKFVDLVRGASPSGELTVLNGISFKVKQGEALGLIGANGAGKTTLLRLIANTLRPDRGVIKRKGSVIPLLELGTGFDGNMTARENILFYGTVLGFKNKEIKSRVNEILQFAGLEDFVDVKIKKFSTGMIARLAFSTAAQIEPDILLLDEILSVGDLPFQQKSYRTLASFKEKKKTIIFVSHNLQSIRKLCDRVMLLHNKKIESIGEPEKVIDEYVYILAEEEKIDKNTHDMDSPNPHISIREVSEMVNKKEYANALLHIRSMMKKEPSNGCLHYLLAFCLQNLNINYSDALAHYNLALEFGFQKFWIFYGRGALLYKLHNFNAAKEDLKAAISLNPKAEGPRIILNQLVNTQQQTL